MFVIGSQLYTYYKTRNGLEAFVEEVIDGPSIPCLTGSYCVEKAYKAVAYKGKPWVHYGEKVGQKRRFEKCDEGVREKLALLVDLLMAVAVITLSQKATQLKIPYTVSVFLSIYGGFAIFAVICTIAKLCAIAIVPGYIADKSEDRERKCFGLLRA